MKRFVALLLCAVGLSCAQLMPAENKHSGQTENFQKIKVSAPVDYKKQVPVDEEDRSLVKEPAADASETQLQKKEKTRFWGWNTVKVLGLYAAAVAANAATGASSNVQQVSVPLTWSIPSNQDYVSPKEQRALEKSAEEK